MKCGKDIMTKELIFININQKGKAKIDVYMDNGTIWLTQKHIVKLYGKGVNTINKHIKISFQMAS